MKRPELSRRKVLASLGVTGVTAFGGLGLTTRSSLAFTTSTQITQSQVGTTSADSYTLQADWRETYNGEVLEDTRSAEFTENGAVISLPNVLPGDSGTMSFQLSLEVPDDGNDNLTVEPALSLNLTGTAENGVNEVERKAGDDTSDNVGELQDFLSVKLWYDEGLANFDVFGGENATQDATENLIDPGAEGTLAEVADAVNGVPLDENGCLGTDETVTISFAWEFDGALGDSNVTQGDSVTFDFEITSEVC